MGTGPNDRDRGPTDAAAPVSPLVFRREPTSFPCLYLDAAEWERLPERLGDPFFSALHEANLRRLDAMRGHALFETVRLAARSSGNSIPRRVLKSYFVCSLAAWRLTRRTAHLDLARAALMAACRSDQWRHRPDKVGGLQAADLATGELLHVVAFGFDALHAELTAAEKDECLGALVDKGLRAYLDGVAARDWWVDCDFNWNSALHGNAGVAALVVRHADRALSDRVLEIARRGLPHLIRAFLPGGGYIEGLMYLCTALAHLTDFVIPLYRLTTDDLGLRQNAAFADTITFLIEMHGGDGAAYNFGDMNEGPAGVALAHILYWARALDRPDFAADQQAKMLAASSCGGDGGPHGLFHPAEAFWLGAPGQPAAARDRRPLRHFAGIDWVRWRGERTWLAFRSGNNGGNHDNDELGTFILGHDGVRFLCDPGYGATVASQHNCVTIRRHEQTDGATARIVRIAEGARGFHLACDLHRAFPHVLAHYRRHLLLIDDTHLLLLDDVRARDGLRNDVRGHLQTRLPPSITPDGFSIEGDGNRLRVRFLSDVGRLRIEPWEFNGPIHTLTWDDAYYRNHSVQPVLLTFGDPDVACRIEPGRVEVTVDGHRARFEAEGSSPLAFVPEEA